MPINISLDPKGLLVLEDPIKNVKRATESILFEIGFAVRSTAIRNIQKGTARTGKFRKSTKTGRRRRSSARGEYPKSDSGRLAQSLIVVKTAPNVIEVGSTFIKYAKFLEEGTRFMDPRPFLAPSLQKNLKNIAKITRRKIQKAF